MIKSVDIFLLLFLHRVHGEEMTFEHLSELCGVPKTEVYRSVQRLHASHLLDEKKRRIRRTQAIEFLLHGIRYAFPKAAGRSISYPLI